MFKYASTALLMALLAGCAGGNSNEQNAGANSGATGSATGASATGTSTSGTYVGAGVTLAFFNGTSSVGNVGPGTTTVTQSGATIVQIGSGAVAVTLPVTRKAGQLFILDLTARATAQPFFAVTGLSAGDTIKTTLPITDSTWLATGKNATASFDANEVKVSDPSTASLSDYANYGVRTVAVNAGDAAWFTYNGDTYLIENMTGQEYNFNGGTDLLLKLSGSVNLANASIVDGAVVLQ